MAFCRCCHSALLGIGNAAQAALPWIQKGIDYTAEHGPEVAGAIAAIVAAFGAMSFAPTAYSTGSSLLNTIGNIAIGGNRAVPQAEHSEASLSEI